MKKIGLFLCLFFVLLGNINAETSKDIMIKYKYTDNISKQTKEIVDNKVEYELNEDKVKLSLSESKNINVIFFEVSNESLEWLKTKVTISQEANVYYLKVFNIKNEKTIPNISINEYSGKEKVISMYDENGNKIEKAQSECYIVIEKKANTETENNENINVYKEVGDIIKNEGKSRGQLVIFIISIVTILVIGLIVIKTRKDKENE